MNEPTAALRATSDTLLRDLEVLETLEEEKRTIPADDPGMLELSGRIEELAQRVLSTSVHQRELSEHIAEHATSAVPTIEETPRSLASVLSEWREAERQLAQAEPGSPEALEAEAQVEQARLAYRRAYDARNVDPKPNGDPKPPQPS